MTYVNPGGARGFKLEELLPTHRSSVKFKTEEQAPNHTNDKKHPNKRREMKEYAGKATYEGPSSGREE